MCAFTCMVIPYNLKLQCVSSPFPTVIFSCGHNKCPWKLFPNLTHSKLLWQIHDRRICLTWCIDWVPFATLYKLILGCSFICIFQIANYLRRYTRKKVRMGMGGEKKTCFAGSGCFLSFSCAARTHKMQFLHSQITWLLKYWNIFQCGKEESKGRASCCCE